MMNSDQVFLEIQHGRIQYHNKVLFHDLNFTIRSGQTWALTGESGAGKTSLMKALAGQLPITGGHWNLPQKRVVLIDSRHHFTNLSNTQTFYYQQRFNSCDSEDAPTIASYLWQEKKEEITNGWTMEKVIQKCQLENLLDKQVILLSNGETRRLLLAAALIRQPALLLIDNPFAGLDSNARKEFEGMLKVITESGIHVVMSLSNNEIPEAVTHVAVLQNGSVKTMLTRNDFLNSPHLQQEYSGKLHSLENWLLLGSIPESNEILELVNGHVRYGSRVILDGVSWKIGKSERWLVSGPNGAGKSTLISLITGDNPQAYANNIRLFGRKRGSGESIWDLKRKIGFVSQELFQYFPQETTIAQAVESGFYDTSGLYQQPSAINEPVVTAAMDSMGIKGYANQKLRDVATSIQRLCFVARALVKYPPLLILDEPCQGLDYNQTCHFKEMVDQLCQRTPISLIYVSHNPEEVPNAVTNHLVLEDGKRVR